MHRLLVRDRLVRLALRGAAAVLAAVGAAAGAQTLDLQQAWTAALAHDASLRAARAAADAGREALPQARAALLPAVSAAAGRHANRLDSTVPAAAGGMRSSRQDYGSGSLSLTVRQPLYRPYERAQLRQAHFLVEHSQAQLEQEEQGLATRVCEAYFDLLLADEQIALVAAQQAAYTTQLDAARKALAAGSGTRTDIDEVRARLDLNAAQELQARQQRLLARQRLRAIVARPFGELAPLDVAALQPQPPAPERFEDWLALAERHSPELEAAQAQLDAARLEVDKARAGHLPTLDVVGQWSRSDSDNINRVDSRYTTRSIGLQLSVPIFSGGGVDSSVRQALAEQTRAEELLQALRDDLGLRLYREYEGVTEGVLRIRALAQAVHSAEQVALSNRKSFEAGVRTTVDVLDAEQQRVAAQRDLAQARYEYLLSRVRLQVLAGVFDTARMQRLNALFIPVAAARPSGTAPSSVTVSAAAPHPVR